MEKRAFKRRPLRLKGICSAPGVGSREVEIRDFCPGGMLLSFKSASAGKAAFSPAHGDIVDIRCIVPSFHDQQPIEFRGRIVRLDAEGAGLAFVDPDHDALRNLHKVAKQRSDTSTVSRQPAHAKNAEPDLLTPSDLNKRALLESCRRIGHEFIEPLMEAFISQAVARLMTGGDKASNITERNAFFDASSAIRTQTENLKRIFARHMEQALHLSPDQMAAQAEEAKSELPKTTLSLVEDDVFEEWLAFSDMARKTEAACLEQLSDLTHRLGVLFHMPLDKDNNPFSPTAFGTAFQNTVREMAFPPTTLHLIYATYRDELIIQLGALYAKLNKYLIKHGVLADLRHKYKIKRISELPGQRGQAALPVEPPQGSDIDGSALDSLNSSNPGLHGTPLAAPARLEQDWYRLAQNINALQKQVMGQAHQRVLATSSTSVNNADFQSQPQFFSTQELMLALSRLTESGNDQYPIAQNPQEIRSKVLSVLSAGKTGQQPKQLPGRDEKILDMAGNLLESVLTDKLISNSVRPWLQKLSIPIFKMALNDESIFTDKTHPARQVINAVALLEFYGAEGDTGHQAVKQRIEGLLAEVEAAEPMTQKVFSRVLRELSVLINVQNKAYEENFREVLSISEEEQRQADTSAMPLPPTTTAIEEDRERREWQKRVRRLKLGDSLLLDAESKPRRLKLAWISESRNRYIFVNVKGLKELALNKDELALGMQTGKLIVLDDGGDSLLDRAQYSMLQKMHSHLLHETTHDQLTSLINRREFERRLIGALGSAQQRGLHHVVCYIDLTQFSVVNNTFGYDGGDRLLAEIAELFSSQLGDRGVLARIGGDEFGMLLEDCKPLEALAITARYKEAMQNYRFTVDDKSLAITFSAGLVSITKESDSIVTVMQAAEASCRVARSKGSNYVQVFSSEDTGVFRHMEVLKWVSKIDEALDNDTLDLRYQPIVEIKGGHTSVHHSEILLGVLDDEGEMISPVAFVQAAEHFRRMVAVDRWVIEHAFQWMDVNKAKLDEIGGLAINLSGSSLNEEGFVDFILSQALNYKVPMHKICFEITETAGIANLSNASEFILAVKKTGCMFALDDFGSGLSSYAYLKNLPVDFLKIDGMFIKNMDANPYDFAVVKSITEIGHFMGKEIIAEYVENETVLGMLREIGVDYAQGYAISKPRNLSDL